MAVLQETVMLTKPALKSLILITVIGALILLFSFNPVMAEKLTLEQCIDIAVENNPEIKSAKNQYKISRESVWSAYGGLLPSLDSYLNASRTVYGPTSYLRYDQNTNQLIDASTGISVSKNYSAGFVMNYTLFNGLSNIYNIRDAKANAKAEHYNVEGTKRDIIYRVKERYFSLLQAKMLVEVRKEAVKRGEEQLKTAESRYELGSSALSDVLKARVQYGQDQLDLVEAENTYELAKADLNYVMDRDVSLDIEPVENLDMRALDYDFNAAFEVAMERNQDLLDAEYSMESAKYQKLSARGDWFPSITVRASYGWNDEDFGNIDNFVDEDYTWSIVGSVSFNIFNGFNTKAQHNIYRLRHKTAQDTYYAMKNSVALQVKQAYLNLEKARQNMRLTEESEEAAREDFNLAQEKYNLGAATILELIDAQVSYKQAETNRIQALFDYNLAVSQLEKAMGL
ncbi:MAG: hypothetical protein GF307_04350 [candidate division Zixibacteria bacterium]|nr:hypothetical protein [candidate division Zixibacteria bacterium]